MQGGKASSEHLIGLNYKQKMEGLAPKETDRSFPEDGVIKNFLGIIFSQSSANMKGQKVFFPRVAISCIGADSQFDSCSSLSCLPEDAVHTLINQS